MEAYLQKMGVMHESVGIKRQYLNIMGPILVQTIRPMLQAEGQWNNEIRITWLHFLRVISFHMKCGYEQRIGFDQHPEGERTTQYARQRRHTNASMVKYSKNL